MEGLPIAHCVHMIPYRTHKRPPAQKNSMIRKILHYQMIEFCANIYMYKL